MVAADYEAGGAACLSVLTDQEFFGGSPADLRAARSACALPVLRKDFTVGALDVCDARAMGADAVLLIVAALDDTELASLLELARIPRLDALVEVHDDAELDRALAAGADLVGVNQRDLRTFEVDHERALRLASRLPDGIVAVAESGIRDAGDVRRLAAAGYDAVLVGETLVGASDREAAVSGMLERSGDHGPAPWRDHPVTGSEPDEGPGIFVKICGITSEADALLAVGMGASAVGFVFAPSPRQMAPSAVADIVKRLPHETVTVGVFRDEAPRRVIEIANQIGLRAVQLHGVESAEDTRWVADRANWTIKAFPAGHRNIERFSGYGAQTLLIDGANPGSGELFDWRLAEGVVDPTRLMVSGGLRPDNVGGAIAHLHPWGVDVSSGVESSPGVKDPGKLREFIAAAHDAARRVAAEQRSTAGALADDSAGGASDDGTAGLFDWQDE